MSDSLHGDETPTEEGAAAAYAELQDAADASLVNIEGAFICLPA